MDYRILRSKAELTSTDSDHESELPSNIAPLIDHTLLAPEATHHDIEKLCAEGLDNEFAAVCVDGSWVEMNRKS